jgi:hypothetical protein
VMSLDVSVLEIGLVSHYTDTHLYVFSLALTLPLIINSSPET